MHMHSPSRHFRGFTIIELMVAISIIAILVALLIPAMSKMGQHTKSSAAINSITVGVEVARYNATRNINPKDLNGVNEAPYRGAAAIVTPTSEIRIVQHDQDAKRDATNFLELTSDANGSYRAGFEDITSIEYLRLPAGAQVFGFIRDGTTAASLDGLRFFAPPFAIRFDQFGHQVVGDPNNAAKDRVVYYDGDCDNIYGVTVDRGSNYQPATSHTWNTIKNRYELPFEEIETVVGIYVVEGGDGLDLSSDGNGALNVQATVDFIKENGRQLLFSRYTGNPMRSN